MQTKVHSDGGAFSPWEGVDGFLVINMDSGTERFSSFMERTGKYLPADKFERVSAVAGRELPSYGRAPWFTIRTGDRSSFWGGTGGCTLSHRKAILRARERGWRNVLIFEDDVILEHPDVAGIAVAEALSHVDGKYMLYLGYNLPTPYGQRRQTLNCGMELWITEGVLAAHAYLVPCSMYDTLLDLMPESEEEVWRWLSWYKAVDLFYMKYVPMLTRAQMFVINPMLCVQADGVSQIGGNQEDIESRISRTGPRACYGLHAVCRRFMRPLRHLKLKLNSFRTYLRARRNGLPGPRKCKK